MYAARFLGHFTYWLRAQRLQRALTVQLPLGGSCSSQLATYALSETYALVLAPTRNSATSMATPPRASPSGVRNTFTMADEHLSQLFTREVHFEAGAIKAGTIRRPLYFYVGLNKLGRIPVERLIKQHGGQIVSHPQAAHTHIIYLIDPLSKPDADGPPVYSVHFVQQCIDVGHLLDLDRYRIPFCNRRASNTEPTTPSASGTSPRGPKRSERCDEPHTGQYAPGRFYSVSRAKTTYGRPNSPTRATSPDQVNNNAAAPPISTPQRRRKSLFQQQEQPEEPHTHQQRRTPPGRAATRNSPAVPILTPQKIWNSSSQKEEQLEVQQLDQHRETLLGRTTNQHTRATPISKAHYRRKNSSQQEEPLEERGDDQQQSTLPKRAALLRAVEATERNDQDSEIPLEEISRAVYTERWAAEEDSKLLAICKAVQKQLRSKEKSPDRLFSSRIWRSLKDKNWLPRYRTAEQCRQRAMLLRDRKEPHHQTDEAGRTEQNKHDTARKRSRSTDEVEYDDDQIQPVYSERRPAKVQRGSTRGQQTQGNENLSRTEESIRRMVRSLSFETQMTQRRVFQVLRANSGDRNRAKAMLLGESRDRGRRETKPPKRNRREVT
eukprot:TRINITY_DN695_c0_g1_i1.p1 TRINITY_DN695_c0_g1~~TRINITY_DN695_c0_g1_i1.p1  ORF type:complete len:607 (-),score=76.94 TRINITY_DN695_c0_g1_i1:2959-4779(-)